MATRKAVLVFNRATSNAAMRERLDGIVTDDRWQKRYRAMNNEIAEWAFRWAEHAFRDYNNTAPTSDDAATIIGIASLVLKHCKENR